MLDTKSIGIDLFKVVGKQIVVDYNVQGYSIGTTYHSLTVQKGNVGNINAILELLNTYYSIAKSDIRFEILEGNGYKVLKMLDYIHLETYNKIVNILRLLLIERNKEISCIYLGNTYNITGWYVKDTILAGYNLRNILNKVNCNKEVLDDIARNIGLNTIKYISGICVYKEVIETANKHSLTFVYDVDNFNSKLSYIVKSSVIRDVLLIDKYNLGFKCGIDLLTGKTVLLLYNTKSSSLVKVIELDIKKVKVTRTLNVEFKLEVINNTLYVKNRDGLLKEMDLKALLNNTNS